MRIGIIFDSGLEASKLSSWGQIAEKHGIDCVWLSNTPRSKDQFLSFSILARDTRKIRMGPMAISPFEVHPVRMGMSLLTLNEISNGRATMVVGGGGGGTTQIFGIPVRKPVTAVKECIEIIKQMASGLEFQYDGSVFRVGRRFRVGGWIWSFDVKPVIYVGANKPRMLRMACRVADGVMMSDMPVDYVETIVKQIKEELANVGRGMEGFRINNFFAWHVKEDYEEAVKEARRHLILRAPMVTPRPETIGLTLEEVELLKKNVEKLIRLYFEGKQPKGIPEETLNKMVEGLTVTGETRRIDECIEKLHQFKKKGLNEIALRVHGEPTSTIKLLGEKVLPQIS